MRSLFEPAAADAIARTRIVLLPGAYHCTEDLLEAGFLEAARARRIPVDLQFVDLELRHLTDREGLARLRGAIVLPARAQGCASIWLCGTSLGGYIALDYASCHPGDLSGICLLAPFLGDRRVSKDIARAGGLARWRPEPLTQGASSREAVAATAAEAAATAAAAVTAIATAENLDQRIWHYIKTRGTSSPLVYLGCGLQDRYAFAHRLLADALPPGAAHFVQGGHDLATWRTLWEKFLDSGWL